MAHRPTTRTRWLSATLLCAALAATASAEPGRHAPVLDPAPCVSASIEDLNLDLPAPVDEIRVMVSHHSPRLGGSEITIEAGEHDRSMKVQGTSKNLRFTPALSAARYRVSLTPDFTALTDACVERIELRHRGALIASVRPR